MESRPAAGSARARPSGAGLPVRPGPPPECRATARELHQHVIVRDAFPSELKLIGELRVAAYRADGFLSGQSAYEPTLRALGADGDGDVLAAVEGGQILGTVMLRNWPGQGEAIRAPGEAEIRALAVAPSARGRGIGRTLVCAITDRARQRGVQHLLLLTQPAMVTAQRLYVSAGFTRLPERDYEHAPGAILLAYGRLLAEGGEGGHEPRG